LWRLISAAESEVPLPPAAAIETDEEEDDDTAAATVPLATAEVEEGMLFFAGLLSLDG